MANYANLKATIAANIKQNGNEEITGPILQSVLTQMTTLLGSGWVYAGVATLAAEPGTPDNNVFYFATTAGTYTNFGGLVVAENEVAIFKYNGTWVKDSPGIASAAQSNIAYEIATKLGEVSGTPGVIGVSQYDHYANFIDASKYWRPGANANTFSAIIPLTPGKYTITAGTTQSIIAFLSALPVENQIASFGSVNGSATTGRIIISAGQSRTFQILDSDTSAYLVVRDDTQGVLQPTIICEEDVTLFVPLKSEFEPIEDGFQDLKARVAGVGADIGLQINDGWMDENGLVSIIENSKHFVIPVTTGDIVTIIPGSNTLVYALLSAYTKPTANGEQYSLCSGESRNVTFNKVYLLTIPADAKYLFVGIEGNGNHHLPISLWKNGVDIMDTRYCRKGESKILMNTALPAATHIPTANASFNLVYCKVRKGDRIFIEGDHPKNFPTSGSFTIQYAYFDAEPYVGMASSHLLSYGAIPSYSGKFFVICQYDGYFAAHFRFTINGQKVTNLFEVTTIRQINGISVDVEESILNLNTAIQGINTEIQGIESDIDELRASAASGSAIWMSRNTFNTPLFDCHRGVQAFGPENSLPAFYAGGGKNVWAIETDFRMTSDGRVVCMHDATINRTMVNMDGTPISDTIYVNQKTLSELRNNYKIGEVNSTTIPNKQYVYANFDNGDLVIPTMEEYLLICAQYGLIPFIELKEDNGIIAQMISDIKKYRLNGRCVISSSSLALLQSYRSQGGEEYIHHIFSSVAAIDTLLSLGNAGLAFDISNLDADISGQYVYGDYNPSNPQELVQMCHSLGLLVCFRADDSREVARKAIVIGLDYMPTNNLWSKEQIV